MDGSTRVLWKDVVIPMRQTQDVRVDQLVERIRGEYLEMPGLSLTPIQAARLWCLDHGMCAQVLNELVDARFLVRRSDGSYVRAGGGS
jgi:hypothetical protein